MKFEPTIDNNVVAELPAARFTGRIVVVDNDSKVSEACADLERYDVIGFDTETRPSFRAGVSYRVSLLQLSTPEVCYLFRLCRIKLHNRILKILGSKRIVKVGVDVMGDIRSLYGLRSFRADGFLDLQHEAVRWGIEEKSLRKLSAIVLGHRVSKAQRLSNWEAETLTEQQREYAATDAWVCIEILNRLEASGEASGSRQFVASESALAEQRRMAVEREERYRRRSRRNGRRKEDKQRNESDI